MQEKIQLACIIDDDKIYVNLITELGGTVPNTYKVFIRGLNTTASNKEILIDNLKLVY